MIDKESRKIEKAGKPSDHKDNMEGFIGEIGHKNTFYSVGREDKNKVIVTKERENRMERARALPCEIALF